MVTKEKVLDILKDCYDPEIPVNIVDLGLIYDVQIEGGKVNVQMTLTAPGCPSHVMISEDVKTRLLANPEIQSADVQVVWDPPWNPTMMTEEAKKALGLD